jgi:hypothetical protein
LNGGAANASPFAFWGLAGFRGRMPTMQRADPNPGEREFRDRSGRLAFFGAVAILLGGCAILLGLASLALPLASAALPGSGPPADLPGALMGLLTYALIGAAFVWAGAGALRRRRWAPAVMQTLAWTWLLGGLCAIPLALLAVDGALAIAAAQAGELPAGLATLMTVGLLGLLVLAGILLPAVYAWVFRDPWLVETCRRHDPGPDWSARCPRPVLALSLLLWAMAALLLPLALRPLVPLFGVLVGGPAGSLLTLAGAALSALLARGIYRLSPAAWWATSAALLLGGLSSVWTLWSVEPREILAASGLTAAAPAGVEQIGAGLLAVLAWTTLALTVLSLVYMVAIRRHFVAAARDAAPQT